MTSAPPVNHSCTTCKSFLTPSEQVALYGTHLGSPVCGLLSKLIGRPGQVDTPRPIADIVGEKCNSWTNQSIQWDHTVMRQKPIYPLQIAMRQPMPDSMGQKNPERVRSCSQCVFFSAEGKTEEETGFMSPMCRAKGQLLLADRMTAYASECDVKSEWRPSDETFLAQAIIFLPELQDGYGKPNLAAQLKGRSGDPELYESDKPVTAEEKEQGIRAWRKLIDPSGYGKDVFLPIFETSYFSDQTDREDIPRLGVGDPPPEAYVDYNGFAYTLAVLWRELDLPPALWGQPGVGKTELFRHMAFLMNAPYKRFSITESSELEDLAGAPQYSPELGTYFRPGRFVKAWSSTCVICVDEPNRGPRDVWSFLRPALDDAHRLTVEADSGRHYDRYDHCYLGTAMNPSWDARNIGSESLASADLSRMMHMFVDLPPDHVERKILGDSLARDGADPTQAKKLIDLAMSIAPGLRQYARDGSIPVFWAIREQKKVVRAMQFFSPVQAYNLAVGDALDPEQRETILTEVRTKAAF